MNWTDLAGMAASIASASIAILLVVRLRRRGNTPARILLADTAVAILSGLLALSDAAALIEYGITPAGTGLRGITGLVVRLLILASLMAGMAVADNGTRSGVHGEGDAEDDGPRN